MSPFTPTARDYRKWQAEGVQALAELLAAASDPALDLAPMAWRVDRLGDLVGTVDTLDRTEPQALADFKAWVAFLGGEDTGRRFLTSRWTATVQAWGSHRARVTVVLDSTLCVVPAGGAA